MHASLLMESRAAEPTSLEPKVKENELGKENVRNGAGVSCSLFSATVGLWGGRLADFVTAPDLCLPCLHFA